MNTPTVASAAGLDHNSLWLSLAGIEYDRRLRGSSSWVGVRAAASAGLSVRGGVTSQWQLFGMARYSVLPPGYKWNWSAFAGLGVVGWIASPRDAERDRVGLGATLGIEGGFQSFRASAELMYLQGHVIVIPGLSVALTF